ncbi:PEP-CTERM sorting domain-containing protein [Methyloversatilis sp.]|uniref:PEP-CTERM sorting domain-containing protein n=1 Tax=Methyloversatilis sp. TaxID=2569862 RepID=UPI00273532BD|nr:PEP-CTERM sorting domain-containing protein [Methyloversatilis sp.]MDP3576517.1 hypothetical protein [Methyloversatilis sp.]
MRPALPVTFRRARKRVVLALALALPFVQPALAKPFVWEFERTGGIVTQTFDSLGPLFTFFVTPTAYQTELLGEITLDTISIVAPGSATSEGGYFDTEIFFYGRSHTALPAGQRGRQVRIPAQPLSGAIWHFVTRSDVSGIQRFDAEFDFETETGSATPALHLVKKAERGAVVTDPGGLGAQIRVWTAAAPTTVTIDKFDVKVTGSIVRYQITPYTNDGTIEIEKDDDAYNNRVVFNGGSIRILDKLNNRGVMFNSGSILIEEAAHLTELTNPGTINLLADSRIENAGRLVTEGSGLISGAGAIINKASFPGDLSPDDPTLPPSRDPGLFNHGTLDLTAGGQLTNTAGARFDNRGRFNLGDDATFSNEGRFTNGSADAPGGMLDSHGTVEHLSGSFANYARIESSGRFANSATLDNQGFLGVLQTGGSGISEFVNAGTVRNGINDAVSLAEPGRGMIRVESSFRNDGVIDNRSIVEVDVAGELYNNKQFLNGATGVANDPDVRLDLRGLMVNADGAELTNRGMVQVAGGSVTNQGSVNNHGRFVITGDGVIGGAQGSLTGGTVFNTGEMQINEGGALGGLVRYRQSGAGAVTTVNGLLEAQTVDIEDGILKGRDRVSTGLLTVGANATVSPGTSPGTLTVLGSMVIDGVLELELAAEAADRLDVSGALFFSESATVRFSFLDGLLPEEGRRYAFADQVSASGGVYGLEQVRFELTGFAGAWDGSGFTVTAVPEPAASILLAAGLCVVVSTAWRRRLP